MPKYEKNSGKTKKQKELQATAREEQQRQQSKEKARRHSIIVKLVSNKKNEYGTRKEIVGALNEEGIRIDESQISRDFKDLHIGKIDGKYQMEDKGQMLEGYKRLISTINEDLLEIHNNIEVMALTTRPGFASGMAINILDAFGIKNGNGCVIGAIAGHDIVLLAVPKSKEICSARFQTKEKEPSVAEDFTDTLLSLKQLNGRMPFKIPRSKK